MPLPLLIPVVLGIAGVVGAGQAVKAGVDNQKAKEINRKARNKINDSEYELDERKKIVKKALANYGRQKLSVLDKHLTNFVKYFSLLKNVKLSDAVDLGKFQIEKFTAEELKEISTSCTLAATALTGLASGAGGGALVAFGAYNGTMLLASAGTGTAISTLSGVAATNATLAWLGGGTLATGGLGMAGGVVVLGSLVAGPFLLIFGSILGAKASKNIANARSNYAKAVEYKEALGVITEKLGQIHEVVLLAKSILGKSSDRLRRSNLALKELIEEFGTNYTAYTKEQKQHVFRAVKYAQLVKAIVDVPVMSKKGTLAKGNAKQLETIQAQLVA